MQRSSGAALASCYDDMPLSLVLFRYLWPFWLFKDASRGDRLTRAAAYRHNRSMRIYLPGYLLKWMLSCVTAFGITSGFGSLSMAQAASEPRSVDVFAIIAAGEPKKETRPPVSSSRTLSKRFITVAPGR